MYIVPRSTNVLSFLHNSVIWIWWGSAPPAPNVETPLHTLIIQTHTHTHSYDKHTHTHTHKSNTHTHTHKSNTHTHTHTHTLISQTLTTYTHRVVVGQGHPD